MNVGEILKDPDAEIGISVDWTQYIGSDTVVGSPTWSLANGLTAASTTFSSNISTVRVSGGQEGCDYLATCRATLASGVIEEATILVRVRTGAKDPRLAQ